MQFSTILVAALLSVPLLASAQAGSAKEKQDTKTTFGVMSTNVAKITLVGEKERWQSNRDAWEVLLAASAKPSAGDLGKLSGFRDKLKANVAKLRAGAEKERWQANIDLWELLLSKQGALGKADASSAGVLLDKMKANVAEIAAAAEKERWQANRDLWQSVIDRAAGAKS